MTRMEPQTTRAATPQNAKMEYKKPSLWKQAIRHLLRNRLAVSGFIVVAFMFLACFIGPLFSPYADNKINMSIMNKPPGWQHWLGTDKLGRDCLLYTSPSPRD